VLCSLVCSIIAATTSSWSSSSSIITSSPAVSVPQSPDIHHLHHHHHQQQYVDIASVPQSEDADEMIETKVAKSSSSSSVDNCSVWQYDSMNGSLPVSRHRCNSPSHSPRRLQRPDASPYHVRAVDRSPLRQQTAGRSIMHTQSPVGACHNSWSAGQGSSYCADQRNGLERMDTSDDMPLNLSTGIRSATSSAQPSANVDNRRTILTSGQ